MRTSKSSAISSTATPGLERAANDRHRHASGGAAHSGVGGDADRPVGPADPGAVCTRAESRCARPDGHGRSPSGVAVDAAARADGRGARTPARSPCRCRGPLRAPARGRARPAADAAIPAAARGRAGRRRCAWRGRWPTGDPRRRRDTDGTSCRVGRARRRAANGGRIDPYRVVVYIEPPADSPADELADVIDAAAPTAAPAAPPATSSSAARSSRDRRPPSSPG